MRLQISIENKFFFFNQKILHNQFLIRIRKILLKIHTQFTLKVLLYHRIDKTNTRFDVPWQFVMYM